MVAQNGSAGSLRTTAGMNAFQLMSSALDISAIFERRDDVISRATRFTSKAPPPEILRRLESSIAKLGGSVKRRDSARCLADHTMDLSTVFAALHDTRSQHGHVGAQGKAENRTEQRSGSGKRGAHSCAPWGAHGGIRKVLG